MDPVWVTIGVNTIGMVVGWFLIARAARRGTEIALTRFEERQNSQGQHLGRLQEQVSNQGGLLADHAVRIGVLENEVGLRGPADYARR